jgi:eukaryotic-like serine/threonine-protein kinase
MPREIATSCGSADHGRAVPRLEASPGGDDNSHSSMVAAPVRSDGNDEISPTQQPQPSPADPTQTSASLPHATPGPAVVEPYSSPSTPTQLRDPARYLILGEHGRGGLGRVSRAHDRELGRDVAIKELLSRGHVSEVRFLREALITARLEHPGIVPVHEAGRWPDGTPFYAMKLVAGRPLRDLIAERNTIEERLGLFHHVIAVADAIAYAHGRNVIHRDLKPANVIVGDFGETVVIDWGLAKDLTTAEESSVGGGPFRTGRDDDLTATGAVLGTPTYMAPEQERGEPVDQRADVFAIGAMLWQLCSLQKVPPINLRDRRRMLRRAGIEKDLATIIDKALAPEPERRYSHAGALATDLKAFKSGARIAARNYSHLGLLARWIRRHRPLAITITIAIFVTAIGTAVGGALYLRNVAAERTRADGALITAQQDRDRARLSEASLLLEKDPAKAQSLLAGITLRSPQHALLSSRAQQRSSQYSITLHANVRGLFQGSDARGVAAITSDGELHTIDTQVGTMRLVDRHLEGPVVEHEGQWFYSRKPFGAAHVVISTMSKVPLLDTGTLTAVSALASSEGVLYALDAARDLYRLRAQGPELIRNKVRAVAGHGELLLVCHLNGILEALRGDVVVFKRTCPRTRSPGMLATVGDNYAFLSDTGVLFTRYQDQEKQLRTSLSGEYEIALSNQGLAVIADYSPGGRAWFLRANATELEPGPVHSSELTSVAAWEGLAAWGYNDGTIMVLDVTRGTVWELRGHPDVALYIAFDGISGRLVSASSQQLRIWDLRAPPVTRIAALPCNIFNIEPSSDDIDAAFDCNDGSVWAWSRSTETVTQVHQHIGLAFGVRWFRGDICSGGWDGRILCSRRGTSAEEGIDPRAGRIMWLATDRRNDILVFASIDGRIWKYADEPRVLYSHKAIPYRVEVSPSGRLLASCDLEGSLIVFDLNNGIHTQIRAHEGPIHGLGWIGDDIWTSSVDGTLRRWTFQQGVLRQREIVRESAPFRLTKVFDDGWVANIGEGVLVIRHAGLPSPLRFELNKRIRSIEVSATGRYVAASIEGEVIIIDLEQHRLASVPMDTGLSGYLRFIDSVTLAVSAAISLKIIRIDNLTYIPF